MLWPCFAILSSGAWQGVTLFVMGLCLGGGIILIVHLVRVRSLIRERARLSIELSILEDRVESLKEFNDYCINHASGVLLAWEDYKGLHDAGGP